MGNTSSSTPSPSLKTTVTRSVSNTSTIPSSSPQKNGNKTITTKEIIIAAKIASNMINNVDLDIILKGLERALSFFNFEELCRLEMVSTTILKLICDNGFHLWRDLLKKTNQYEKYYDTIPNNNNNSTKKDDDNPPISSSSSSYWKLCLIRSKQNDVDDELSHLSNLYLVKEMLKDVSKTSSYNKNIKIYGLLCDLITTDNIQVAKVLSRVRVSAMSTILVSNMDTLSKIKNFCLANAKYNSLVGKLAFISYTADDERNRLKVVRVSTPSEEIIETDEVPGYLGRADELIRVKPENWFLKGAIGHIFSFIYVFQDEKSAQNYIEIRNAKKTEMEQAMEKWKGGKFHYVTLDLFDEVFNFSNSARIATKEYSFMYDQDITTYYSRKVLSNAYRGPSFRRYHIENHNTVPFIHVNNVGNNKVLHVNGVTYQKSGPRIHPLTFRELDADILRRKLVQKKINLQNAFIKVYIDSAYISRMFTK